MNSYSLKQLALAIAVLSAATALAEGPVQADWLYLTHDGAWVSRSDELRKQTTTLPLPVEHLTAGDFWWQADDSSLMLNWQTSDKKGWLTEDTVVQIDGWSGSWNVVQLDDKLMVLAQAGVRRPLPHNQWYRLSWVVGQNLDTTFELAVTQAEAERNAFRYAWFDDSMSAEVRYSLDLAEGSGRLRQQLVLRNSSNYTVSAPGYSYAQSQGEGREMMTRQMSMSTEPEADAKVGTPRASDSSGQATLVSDAAVTLPENSVVWLEVQTVELSQVDHKYRFNWYTRQSETIPGQWTISIAADDDLPALGGPVQVAVWDRQVALLETQYRPQRSNQARLDLGQSDMMTLATESLGGQEWLLTLTNRNSQMAEAALELNHRDESRLEQAGLTIPVPGNSEVKVRVRLSDNQLSARPE